MITNAPGRTNCDFSRSFLAYFLFFLIEMTLIDISFLNSATSFLAHTINLYSLCRPGNQDYQKIIHFYFFFTKKGRNGQRKSRIFIGISCNHDTVVSEKSEISKRQFSVKDNLLISKIFIQNSSCSILKILLLTLTFCCFDFFLNQFGFDSM